MTSSARDLRYGRRGGRWADSEAGTDMAASFARTRDYYQRLDRDDPLPDRTAEDGTVVPQRRWPTVHDRTARLRPTTTAEWQGLARQALARQAAGVPLTALDVEALDMYPDPPSGVLGPVPARQGSAA